MSDKEPILNSEEFNIDFQNFDNSIPDNVPTIPTTQFTDQFSSENIDTKLDLDSDNLLLEDAPTNPNETPQTTSAFWSLQFYQQYFNVNDAMVLERLMYACIPTPNSSYLDKLRPIPDFYGPIWVCITLIFSTAISGNMADFFQTFGKDQDWTYDFKKVTIAATVVFSYVTVIPALLMGYLWWRKSQSGIKLADVLSLYGTASQLSYPFSLLLCVNYEWVRWILVLVLICTSGAVLTQTVYKVLEQEPRQMAFIITGILAGLHVAVILLFKMYFFASSSKSAAPINPSKE